MCYKKAFDLITAVVTSPGYIYIYLNLIEFLISLPGTDKEYFTLYEKRSFKKNGKILNFFLIYRYEFKNVFFLFTNQRIWQ